MGVLGGYKQVTLYLDPIVYEKVGHVARMLDVPVYKFVNDALVAAIEQRTTPEQRKAIDLLASIAKRKPVKGAKR